MRIGIVIPAFNVAPYIRDAIRSLLFQSHQDWTAVIVDDGSTDATAAIAAAFPDPRLNVIRQANAGVSAARNRGMTEIDADAVLFLDADDWLSPTALSRLAAALAASPEAVAAAGPFIKVPGGRRAVYPPAGDLLHRLLTRNLFVNGGHVLIRRAALARTGPFNTALRYGEDWEYWIRLALLGSFAAAPSPTPLLFARERHGGAYLGMAARRDSFAPCMDAIFTASALLTRLGAPALAAARARAEAENDWIAGRELIRHGDLRHGRRLLRRSILAAPGLKRLALLAAAALPHARPGPFRPYPAPGEA